MCKDLAMTPHRVAVLALDEVIGYDMSIPPQIFNAATDEHGESRYDVRICGLDRSPLRVHSGYAMVPDHGREALAGADTVIIPGTRIEGPRRHGTLPPEVAEALALIPPGARIMSICTGAFVLGAAGILDGRPATTHWAYAEQFRRLYPEVRLDEDVLFVDDGDVLTSAGLGAGVDLCLHVVRRDHGHEVANRAARYCVVPPWRDGGQSQYIERQVPEPGTDGTAPARAWALAAPAPRPGRPGRARADERAHVQPPVPGGDRDVPGHLADPATGPARPAPAGDHGPPGGPRRHRVRPGHGGLAAPASARVDRGFAAGLPQDVPGILRVTACLGGTSDVALGVPVGGHAGLVDRSGGVAGWQLGGVVGEKTAGTGDRAGLRWPGGRDEDQDEVASRLGGAGGGHRGTGG
jgi:putative intracellular protease/amidase